MLGFSSLLFWDGLGLVTHDLTLALGCSFHDLTYLALGCSFHDLAYLALGCSFNYLSVLVVTVHAAASVWRPLKSKHFFDSLRIFAILRFDINYSPLAISYFIAPLKNGTLLDLNWKQPLSMLGNKGTLPRNGQFSQLVVLASNLAYCVPFFMVRLSYRNIETNE